MPGVATLRPARFALGPSAAFRTTPGLIFFYSYSGEDCSDLTHSWASHREFPYCKCPGNIDTPRKPVAAEQTIQ